MKEDQKKTQEEVVIHRYESDRTKKERMELERRKLKEMNWKDRLIYIVSYYKSVMLAFAAVILIIVVICQAVENSKYETILNVSVIGASLTEDSAVILEELEEQFGTEDKYEKIVFDTSYVMQDNGEVDYTVATKFTTMIAAHDMDVMIMNQMWYRTYVEQGLFLDLSTLFTEQECETYGITPGMDYLDITDTAWLEHHPWVSYEPVYLAVASNTENTEKIKEFIIAVKEET